MTNYDERLYEIIDKHRHDVDMDFSADIRHYKNTNETVDGITSLIKELIEEVIKKPHILPKNAQHLESVRQGINFYHRQMRKRVDKLKEQTNDHL